MATTFDARQVEAARYALLRRLALAMRHHMVVHLQPMGMITELLERRLKAAQPDVGQVQDAMAKIHDLSRAAVDSCLDVVTWLAPPADVQVPLDAAVEECVVLLRSNFSFRGFAVTALLGSATMEVPCAAVRHVLPAVLLALTDRAAAPADVAVMTTPDGDVTVDLTPRTGDPGFPGNDPYRFLDWAEVEALAAAEGVGIARSGDSARLSFA